MKFWVSCLVGIGVALSFFRPAYGAYEIRCVPDAPKVLVIQIGNTKSHNEDVSKRVNQKLDEIFHSPSFQRIDASSYDGQVLSLEDLKNIGIQEDVDVVVQPLSLQLMLYTTTTGGTFTPKMTFHNEQADIQIAYWHKGMTEAQVLSIDSSDEENLGNVWNDDSMMQHLLFNVFKSFPYASPVDESLMMADRDMEEQKQPIY